MLSFGVQAANNSEELEMGDLVRDHTMIETRNVEYLSLGFDYKPGENEKHLKK